MNKNQKEVSPNRQQQWQGLTLAQYVELRNGVPLGVPSSLRNMLQRSFGAASFAGFWQYWNPIWGYGLGKYVYSPMHRVLPAAIALIMTFVVSGGIHDLVIMALRRSMTLLFTPWFFVLGVGVVLGRAVGMDLSNRSWWIRAGTNLAYLVIGLAITLIAKRVLSTPTRHTWRRSVEVPCA
jgi:hypothetical protein